MGPDIYKYTDYRKYLKDFYESSKKENNSFSYQYFANKAGFKTKTFLFNVIQGDKPLSKKSIFGLTQAMKLNKKETDYFETLVNLNEAKTIKEKEHYFSKLQSFNKKSYAVKLRENQFDFYSKWQHLAVRELINILDFKGDFNLLAKSVNPPITPKQARKSVELLEGLGLIKKLASGKYKQTEKVLTTGDEVVSLAIQKFQKENLALASEAIDRYQREMRDISSLTGGVSKEGFTKLKTEIQLFRKKLAGIIEKDEPSDRVYQVNFQLFPLSSLPKKD